MEKVYNITDLRFESDYMILIVDGQTIKLKLTDISDKLAKASEKERKEYKISPSGYGIHWKLLDEDLSINGLIKANKSKHAI
jgi:Protein of unknown function (DUF2442)